MRDLATVTEAFGLTVEAEESEFQSLLADDLASQQHHVSANDRYWPILLKNSFPAAMKKF